MDSEDWFVVNKPDNMIYLGYFLFLVQQTLVLSTNVRLFYLYLRSSVSLKHVYLFDHIKMQFIQLIISFLKKN